MKRGVFVLLALLLPALSQAGTRYVRTDGNNANTGLTNTSSGAWRTIDWATDHTAAGDVVRVQAGTYVERVGPSSSGAVGNPITFVADGVVTFCGMDIVSHNYLRFIGFTIDDNGVGCPSNLRVVALGGINTGLEFWNNTFRDANYVGLGSGAYDVRNHNAVVIGNTFTGIGPSGSAVLMRGNHNVFAYNDISGIDPDAFQIDGTFSLWLNNYIHDMVNTNGAHADAFQSNSSSLGLSYNLFEGNFIVGLGNVSDEHGALLQNQTVASCSTGTCGPVTENLFRRNVWHNLSGQALSADSSGVGPMLNTRQVHDTVVEVYRTAPGSTYGVYFRAAGNTASLYNNLYDDAWSVGITTNIRAFYADTGASISAADYNLAYKSGVTLTFAAPWTAQAHPRPNVNPLFVDRANDDFTLQASSGARNVAGALTTVTGSGTGTTFTVASGGGGWFRGLNPNITTYGGNLTSGDVITVGTTTRTVASVSGDALTVTESFSWANGDPVYLGPSPTPDIGAYPYKPGGYGLSATYTVAGGVVTATPSDADLVRFVICYEDGIPTTVDNAGPYTCAIGARSLSVQVCPRYASKRRCQFATLTPPPAPPADVRLF